MTIKVDVTTKTEAILKERARRSGQDLKTFASGVLEREAHLSELSFEELVRPLHEWTDSQGYAEEEIEGWIDDAVAEVRNERRLARR